MRTTLLNSNNDNLNIKARTGPYSKIPVKASFLKQVAVPKDTFESKLGISSEIKFKGKEEVDSILDSLDLGKPISSKITNPKSFGQVLDKLIEPRDVPEAITKESLEYAYYLMQLRGNEFDKSQQAHIYARLFAGASYVGHLKLIKDLLKAGHDVDAEARKIALSEAAGRGHLEVVNFWIHEKVSLDGPKYQMAPLAKAAQFGHLEVVKALIEAGADVNGEPRASKEGGYSAPIFLASKYGHLEVVKALISAGARVNLHNRSNSNFIQDSYSPLFEACYNNHLEIVKALTSAGADVNFCFPGNTLYMYKSIIFQAAKAKNPEIIKFVIANGADVSICNQEGQTPLFYANTAEAVNALLATGKIDIHHRDEIGGTALHYAAGRHQAVDAVKALLDANANPYMVNKYQLKPLDVCNRVLNVSSQPEISVEISKILREKMRFY